MPKFNTGTADAENHRRRYMWAVLLMHALGLACVSAVPRELSDARDAYSRAAEGPAADYSVAQLRTAHKALNLAEQTFDDEGDTSLTRERALKALREARQASAHGADVVAQAGSPAPTPEPRR